jgi:hypothetical protein
VFKQNIPSKAFDQISQCYDELVMNTSNSVDEDVESEKDMMDTRGKIDVFSKDSVEVDSDINSSVEESDFDEDFIVENK